MPAKQVSLGERLLHGADRFGEWVVERVEGWHSPPAAKGDVIENAFEHGEKDIVNYYAARTPTISGILFHSQRGYAVSAFEALSASASVSKRLLSITDGDQTRTAMAKLVGMDYTQVSPNAWRFQLRLKRVDPFRYGEARSFDVASGSTTTAFHRGTVEAWPNMIVTGDMPSYTVRFRGVDVEVPGGILPGQTHRIEYRTRRLYENNSFVMGGFGATNFRPVEAGIRSDLQLIAPSGSGQLKMTVNDTYL